MVMVKEDVFISVVLPIKNQAGELEESIEKVSQILEAACSNYEILIVDDASMDSTQAVVSRALERFKCVRYFALTRAYGLDICIYAGLENSIGDYVVVLLPGYDPYSLILPGIQACRGQRSTVYGAIESSGFLALPRKILGKAFHFFTRKVLGLEMPESSSYFRVFDRSMVVALSQIRGKHPMMKRYGSMVGRSAYAIHYTPIGNLSRWRRESLWDRIRYGVDIIWMSGKDPLKPFLVFALLLSLAITLTRFQISEWDYIVLLGGAHDFLFLAVISLAVHFLTRILPDASGAPMYFVHELKESSVMLSEKRHNVQ